MQTKVDRRTIRLERDDAALAELEGGRAAWLDRELVLARLLCRIDRKAAFLAAGAASVEELASRRGYDGPRARDLCRLGYALDAVPGLEEELRRDRIRFPAACALGRIYSDPTLLEPDDAWLDWAREERLPDLRRRIQRRIESVRQQGPADRLWSAYVTTRTADMVARCRLVAAQKAGRVLTNGQLLDVFATGYLAEHDPLERTVGTRRLPPTSERPHDRTIPAEVSRALEERSGGLCEFGACERPAVETCHVVPHHTGSGRETTDLVRGCRPHHKAFDAGWIHFLGWTDAKDERGAGLPVFLAIETKEILRPKPRPTAGEACRHPEWLLRAIGSRLRRRLERRARAGGADRARRPSAAASGSPPRRTRRRPSVRESARDAAGGSAPRAPP